MPIERRQIILSEKELLQAIRAYSRMRTDFLPHGEVIGFTLEPTARDGGVHLTVDVGMIYGQTRQTISIQTAEADIIELLIRCCLENNIPIPKIGRKSAGIIDGMLTLFIYFADVAADVAAP